MFRSPIANRSPRCCKFLDFQFAIGSQCTCAKVPGYTHVTDGPTTALYLATSTSCILELMACNVGAFVPNHSSQHLRRKWTFVFREREGAQCGPALLVGLDGPRLKSGVALGLAAGLQFVPNAYRLYAIMWRHPSRLHRCASPVILAASAAPVCFGSSRDPHRPGDRWPNGWRNETPVWLAVAATAACDTVHKALYPVSWGKVIC